MCHISIVAREEFISVVTDAIGEALLSEESFKVKEMIPDTAFISVTGDEEYAQMATSGAITLVGQGFTLNEIAESLQSAFSSESMSYQQSGRAFEAVIVGYSQWGEAQYHLISNKQRLESFYPAPGESLYYTNGLEAMQVLEKMLMIHGVATSSQAQSAQFHFLEEAAKIIPNVNKHGKKLLIKRPH